MANNSREGRQVGNYRLLHKIGKGGFAEVWLGRHIHLGTYAALKFLLPHDDQTKEQFLREAKVVHDLRHPHIIQLLDFMLIDTYVPCMIMAYAENGSLRMRHPKQSKVKMIDVLSYLRQIAEALDYAHSHKIIHRDIKPENLLVNNHKEILLSDFGIGVVAHRTASIPSAGSQEYAGTIPYSAPEQLQGNPRPASDIYSLGVVVYEWLSGTVPFQASTFFAMAALHIHQPPEPLHVRVPGLPPTISTVVMRCLEKDYKNRYPSASAFVAALQSAYDALDMQTRLIAPFPPPNQVPPPQQVPQKQQVPPQQQVRHQKLVIPPSGPVTKPISPIAMTDPSVPTRQKPERKPRRLFAFTRREVLALIAIAAITEGGWQGWEWYRTHITFGATKLYTFTGHSQGIPSVDWSPNGNFIASGSLDGTVQIWSPDTGEKQFTLNEGSTIYAIAWSPDGKRIASANDKYAIKVWDAMTGQVKATYLGHWGIIQNLAWSPDGNLIASCSLDQTVQVWEATTGKKVFLYAKHASEVNAIAWSPDGTSIASGGSDKKVQIWSPMTGKTSLLYSEHSGTVFALDWSRRTHLIASGDDEGMVQVWDPDSGETRRSYYGHSSIILSVIWSPDGQLIASGSGDNTMQVWQYDTGHQFAVCRDHSNSVNCVDWSPDGRKIVSASEDRLAIVWKLS